MNKHTFVVLAYKESEYLEECIKSVINQSVKTNVVIATSTPNNYIKRLAEKYKLQIIENKGEKGLANDFNFALNCTNSKLVTIAHQDDIYEKNYAKEVLKEYEKHDDASIFYTKYFELRDNKKIYSNLNLNIKKFLLFLTKFRSISNFKIVKKSLVRFGNAICCPSVTFCMENLKEKNIFDSHFTCNMDWSAWDKISNFEGRFIYISKPLMGHRVHEESETTKIINSGVRTKEDYEMYCKFWPKPIAKILTKIYKYSEKSNKLK